MAQSSNYKQYGRTTRVLTEESGFSGGMLWTGNNIDSTHLKTIVNFDYDDTTGYLKTRDPFVSINSAAVVGLDTTLINLNDFKLLNTYNICAFKSDLELTATAGRLYVFARPNNFENVWETTFGPDNLDGSIPSVVCIFQDHTGCLYNCSINLDFEATLYNTNLKNTLLLYDNYLYGIGRYDVAPEENRWLWIYYLEQDDTQNKTTYALKQLDFDLEIIPRINSVTLLEASVSGFNAARGEFTFVYGSTEVTEGPLSIQGLYLTDDENNVIVSPRIGQTVYINVCVDYLIDMEKQVDAGCVGLFLHQSNDTGSIEDVWQCVDRLYAGDAEPNTRVYKFPFVFQKKETSIGLVYYGDYEIPADEKLTVYSDKAVDVLLPYVVTANANLENLKLKNYNLAEADSSCIWHNRMCLWGTESNNNCLFLSEVDNFYYYPIPNNVAVFDTNIISCIPYKNNLLVFTADKIYRLTENKDGTFTQDVVQNDMPMSKTDSAYLTAIKNMVLFKSGNYFYMIVPKTQSLTDELSVAPIYKNVSGLLNNLDKGVLEVLQLLYPERGFKSCTILNNAPSNVYSEQDTIHILYDVVSVARYIKENTVESKLHSFKLFLNYNTNLRAWTLYLEDITDCSLEVASLTSARLMTFVRVSNEGTFSIVAQQHSQNVSDGFRVLLDTGYRTLTSSMQKRFREIQLKLYSDTENITAFGTSFLVDGVWRRNYTKLQESLIDNNTVSLVPELDLNTVLTELTAPINEYGNPDIATGSDAIELSNWTLDFSHFKRGAPVTVRTPVSGKGFNPRFIFMAPTALNIYINEINWVYRLMYGR